ncbi:MAG: hypothetical protein M1813_002640 [Trichoglossum hirsutum]|nr:MAG: hypothetical protein M1813_002640 [Trichoglossum hirsutum]
MSYVSYGSEAVVRGPHHHHRHHEHRRSHDHYPDDYVARDSRLVRRLDDGGGAGEVVVRREPGYGAGTEYLRETVLEDDYRRGRRHHDRERYGGATVSRRRAMSLGRDHGGRVVGYYSSRYGEDPRRSLGAVARRDVDYGVDEWERRPRRRSTTRNEKLVAGAAGAGLAIAGKEYWDNKKGRSSSPLETAATGVAGAVAGVEAAKLYERSREHSRGGSRRATFSDSRYDGTRGYSPGRGHERSKTLGEAALAAIGLGEVARHHSRSRSRSRSRSHGHQHHRGSSVSPSHRHSKTEQAAKAALTAAVAEAVASRHDPGGLMTGERGRKIAKAAITAGGLEAVVDDDPDHHTKRNIAEAVIGSLAGQRILNGRHSRSRSRSHSRSRHRGSGSGSGALGDLAKGGLAAAAGKAFMDYRNRSKSRDRSRPRSNSSSPRRRRRSSISGVVEKGLGALGLDDKHDRDHGERRSRSRSRPPLGRRGTGYPHGERGYSSDRGGGSSSSDDEMSSGDERRMRKKLRGKELFQAGVATVATIHSAHSLYESMEARDERHNALEKGEITPEQARRQKAKAQAQDLASLGLAMYGVHGAAKSWEAMMSRHGEKLEFDRKRATHRQRKSERSKRAESADSWRRSVSPDHRSGNNGYHNGPTYHDGNPYAAGGLGPSSPSYSDERH